MLRAGAGIKAQARRAGRGAALSLALANIDNGIGISPQSRRRGKIGAHHRQSARPSAKRLWHVGVSSSVPSNSVMLAKSPRRLYRQRGDSAWHLGV